MNFYMNYIKIGEILKSPNEEKLQYILKCHHEHYFILESFMFPCAMHCDAQAIEENPMEAIKNDVNADDEEEDVTAVGTDDVTDTLEYENNKYFIEGDPLNLIKNKTNSDSENEVVIEEYILDEPEADLDHKVHELNKSLEAEEIANYTDEINTEFIETDNEYVAASDGSESTTFFHNFMKSKQNVKTFIEAYRNQPALWNRELPQYASKKEDQQQYLIKIRQELKEKIDKQLSNNQVIGLMTYLHRKIRDNMVYLNSNNLQMAKKRKREWFLKELEFLESFEEANINVNFKYQHCNLEANKTRQVLKIYEKFPSLWNTSLIENCCKNKRTEALEQMLGAVNTEAGLNIDEDGLKKYIHLIHTRFTKEKRYQLRKSGAVVSKDEFYKDMLFLQDHVGPFKCSVCGIELKNPLYFKVHKAQHDGSMPLKCSLCSKEFKILGTYVLHARRHLDDLEEICKECGKKFINPYELKVHMRFHTGSKPFCCEICGVSFRHIQTFASHKRRHEKKYLHTCPTCSKGFYSKAKMDDHIRSHKQIREFVCKTCGKAFIMKKTLQQHQVTHEDVRKHVCSLCGKSFKLKVGLTQHMKTHGTLTYERPEGV